MTIRRLRDTKTSIGFKRLMLKIMSSFTMANCGFGEFVGTLRRRVAYLYVIDTHPLRSEMARVRFARGP